MTELGGIRVERLSGDRVAEALPALARLRIVVFRDYPYLYDGSEAYESAYLAAFAAARGAVLIAAIDGDTMVGASTAAPMPAQAPEIRLPFEARGEAVDQLFYFGESVLLPAYRGRGIGHAFFDLREAAARGAGATAATFASVVRRDDHPARPAGYRPNDDFWRKRGYQPVPGLTTQLRWPDIGDGAETEKTMQYWMRAL